MSGNCQLDENKKNCPCPGTGCERHGACCKCVMYHREQGNLPVCLRK
jgi:hypothetical protein